MNIINPRKLLNSKWTALAPKDSEKHFLIVEVEFDEDGTVVACIIEAVMSRRQTPIQWQTLKDDDHWIQGWK